MTGFDVVIPSAGRASLELTLLALASGPGPSPRSVVVDDHGGVSQLPGVTVLRTARRGPAAARNAGWRHARAQ